MKHIPAFSNNTRLQFCSVGPVALEVEDDFRRSSRSAFGWERLFAALALLTCFIVTGCQSNDRSVYNPPGKEMAAALTNTSTSIILREGDVVRITFPSAANLNSIQAIRRDGKITLQLVGEVTAAGFTPTQLEAEVIKAYAPQGLLTKEVTVSVEASAFPVFVMGAVQKPGKLLADRPITALEAIMEAGGFDTARANQKKVLVIRHEANEVKNFKLNLDDALRGKPTEPMNLKPGDIIFVSEKFTWF